MSRSTIRTLLLSCVIILATGAGLAYMILSTTEQAQLLEEQIRTVQEQRAQERAFQNLQNIAVDTEEQRAQLSSYFLSRESESIDFLNLVETLAPQAGVTLEVSNLNVLETGSADEQWIQVAFEFQGERSQVDAFLVVLENLPFLSRVTDVRFEVRSGGNWVVSSTMQVMLYAYDE